MDIVTLLAALVPGPTGWIVALLVVVAVSLLKGWLITRPQADELINAHIKIEENQKDSIAIIREDRDKSIAIMQNERDLWKATAERSQEISQQIRDQNGALIDRLEVVDYMLTAMRDDTGVQGGDSGGRAGTPSSPNEE